MQRENFSIKFKPDNNLHCLYVYLHINIMHAMVVVKGIDKSFGRFRAPTGPR